MQDKLEHLAEISAKPIQRGFVRVKQLPFHIC
jgi:hypothetical protein